MITYLTLFSRKVVLLSADRAKKDLDENVRLLVSGAAQEATSLLRASLLESQRLVSLTTHMLAKMRAAGAPGAGFDRSTVDFMKSEIPFASWVGLADTSGTLLAASDGLLEGRGVSGRPWFEQVRGTRGAFFGDVHTATLLQTLLAPNASEPLRFVDVAAPVMTANGSLSHVLGIHLHWDWARDVQQRTMVPVYAAANAELFVYSPDNTVLLSPDRALWKESAAPSRAPGIPQGAAVYASAGAIASALLGLLLTGLVWLGMRPFHRAARDARRLEASLADLAGVPASRAGSFRAPRRTLNLGAGPGGSHFKEARPESEWPRIPRAGRGRGLRALALRSELHVADAEREDLREQLHTLQTARLRSQADLESPLAKALAVLAALRSDPRFEALGGWAEGSLSRAVTHLLGRGSMMVPDLGRQVREGALQLDRDTTRWLFSEVAPSQGPGGGDRSEVGSPHGGGLSSPGSPGGAAAGARRPSSASSPTRPRRPADAADLEAARSGGRPLLAVSLAALEALGLPARLRIDPARFAAFAARVEAGYRDNPYHNGTHAAEVAQCMAFLLTRGGLGAALSDEDRLAALLAALVHDFEHPGVNNNFLVAVSDPLALRYNDRSPLESHHVSAAWTAMTAPVASSTSSPPFPEIRRTVIDMAQHFEVLGAFRKRVAAGALAPAPPPEAPPEAPAPAPAGGARPGAGRLAPEDRRLLLSVAIKASAPQAADIGHAARPLPLHLDWSQRVAAEFYAQGDRERAAGLPVSAFMDRATANLPKSQVGFCDFIVLPLLGALAEAFPAAGAALVAGAGANYAHWHALLEAPAPEPPPAPAPAPAPATVTTLAPAPPPEPAPAVANGRADDAKA
eukprot:tig00021489_g21653.t1